jgi:leader peptidase (prepilin peptidase)/N-methyltransferase
VPVVADFPAWFWFLVLTPFGLVWGSFLNVVIHRVPRGENVAYPPSRCPGCGARIAPRDNVPVLSYLLLRGRARCCGIKISPRYPLIEALGGALAAALVQLVLLELSPDTSAGRALGIFSLSFALGLALLALAFIDLEYMILPDSLTLGAGLLGLVSAGVRGTGFINSAIGAAVGFAIIYLPFELLYSKLRGTPGMGRGDAKLAALAGAWFGAPGAVFALFAGACPAEAVAQERAEVEAEYAAAEGEARAELERERQLDPMLRDAEEGLGQARVPFGPFLALATLEFLLFERAILAELFEPLKALWS